MPSRRHQPRQHANPVCTATWQTMSSIRCECSGRRRKHGTCFHFEESTMIQTIQRTHSKSLTQPSLSVIGIEIQEPLPVKAAFIDILIEATRQRLEPAYRAMFRPCQRFPWAR